MTKGLHSWTIFICIKGGLISKPKIQRFFVLRWLIIAGPVTHSNEKEWRSSDTTEISLSRVLCLCLPSVISLHIFTVFTQPSFNFQLQWTDWLRMKFTIHVVGFLKYLKFCECLIFSFHDFIITSGLLQSSCELSEIGNTFNIPYD